MEGLEFGLRVVGSMGFLAALYYVVVMYPVLWFRRRRKAARQ